MPDDQSEELGARVLVVDGNARAREVVRGELEKRLYQVQTVASADEALSIINAKPDAFDVIISEIVLSPKMDGFGFLAEVRRGADTAALPFIFLTGDRRVPNRVKALDLGVDDYITKPCSFDEFSARLGAMMRRRKAEATRPDESAPPAGGFDLAGDLSAIGVIEIVNMLTTNQKTGLLRLHTGVGQAELYLDAGTMCHATCAGAAEGVAAGEVLLQIKKGTFDFRSAVPAPMQTISREDSGILLDAQRQADEAQEAIRMHSERLAARRRQAAPVSAPDSEEEAGDAPPDAAAGSGAE